MRSQYGKVLMSITPDHLYPNQIKMVIQQESGATPGIFPGQLPKVQKEPTTTIAAGGNFIQVEQVGDLIQWIRNLTRKHRHWI